MTAARRTRTWPRVTMKDVAREANVSDATVSRVLDGSAGVSESTRSAVLDAIRRTGYIRNGAARQLAGSASDVVGLLVRDVRNPYYGLLHSELQHGATERGLRLLTVSPAFMQGVTHELNALDHLLEQRVRGLLIATGTIPLDRVATFAEFVPVVVVGRPVTLEGIHSIAYDEPANGRLAAEEVWAHGHRDVAVVATAEAVSFVEHSRSEAMIARLRELGARPVPVHTDSFARLSDVTPELVRLTREGRVSAAMFPSDERVVAFLESTQGTQLRVPEDLSVTGVDGVLPGLKLLGLSTVRLPAEELARRGIEVMAEELGTSDSRPPVREVYPSTFIAGHTLRRADPGEAPDPRG
ncbi:LacI family DNA-binding transcriptional regulator [Microbacterium sp. zg.B96]|nr:LacI family DNA-binding transcriptional regulator [Microbacterium sp. zg.B96]MCR2782997.1 LacI family transcriptional regulator [Microbacterium sp. zg.B96]